MKCNLDRNHFILTTEDSNVIIWNSLNAASVKNFVVFNFIINKLLMIRQKLIIYKSKCQIKSASGDVMNFKKKKRKEIIPFTQFILIPT